MKKSLLYLSVFLFAIAGCSTYNSFYSNYDRSTDFKKYRTFAWLPDSGMVARTDSFRNSAYDNDIIRNNVKNYVAHDLSQRGLRVNVDNPDALIQLVLLNEKRERYVADYPFYPSYYYRNPFYHPYYYPYYDYYTYYGWGCSDFYCGYSPSYYKETFVRGTITINMFDREQQKLVWTGSAEGNIYDPSFIEQDIHPAIKRIMKSFPIKTVENGRPNDRQNAISRR